MVPCRRPWGSGRARRRALRALDAGPEVADSRVRRVRGAGAHVVSGIKMRFGPVLANMDAS